jgi:hypothetical protein
MLLASSHVYGFYIAGSDRGGIQKLFPRPGNDGDSL